MTKAKDLTHELEILEEYLARLKEEGEREDYGWTHYLPLYIDNQRNRWAIVLAYMAYDTEMQIWGKVAYQPTNSLMQEYDIDWTMPFNEETDEVDDTEIRVDDETDLKWLLKQWERQYNELKEKENEEEENM